MAFYTFAKNFHDRNIVNGKIRYLKSLRKTLDRLGELVFQSGKIVKLKTDSIINDKKITTYPIIREILIDAEKVVLDSPWKYQALCAEAIFEIDKLLIKLKKEQEKLTVDKKDKNGLDFEKGWK